MEQDDYTPETLKINIATLGADYTEGFEHANEAQSNDAIKIHVMRNDFLTGNLGNNQLRDKIFKTIGLPSKMISRSYDGQFVFKDLLNDHSRGIIISRKTDKKSDPIIVRLADENLTTTKIVSQRLILLMHDKSNAEKLLQNYGSYLDPALNLLASQVDDLIDNLEANRYDREIFTAIKAALSTIASGEGENKMEHRNFYDILYNGPKPFTPKKLLERIFGLPNNLPLTSQTFFDSHQATLPNQFQESVNRLIKASQDFSLFTKLSHFLKQSLAML